MFPDMEWQTPAVSEKFQSRFGRLPGTADSADTGGGALTSDRTEDFCRVGSGASFQPIRSQIPIPTAHVMPSTASEPHLRALEEPQASAELHRTSSASRTSSSSSSNSKSSSLSKSASSPNLDAQGAGGGGAVGDPAGPKPDCLSRFRSLVNGLDHSLFPSGEHTRFDESQRFDTPSVEPTLNQTALTGGMCPDGRLRVQSQGRGTEAYKGSLENSYKALPEARSEACRAGQAGAAGPAGLYPGSLGPLQAQALQREHAAAAAAANAYEAQSLQDACSALSSCHQQQQHKQQLESLRLQVEQMQLMSSGLGINVPYPSLYSAPLHPEAAKWETLVKANEGLLKEKEILIERQKQHMVQLEQRLRDSELQVHGALLGRGAPYADVCMLRLQEAQRENAFLRAQFAERAECAAMEQAEAERRLGGVEAETRHLTDALRESGERHGEELRKQEERIRSRDKHINNLKKKCQKEAEQNREKQQRIETLERYLADLPTMEDYQSQNKQLLQTEEKAAQLQARLRELGVSLEEARSHAREKEALLEDQRRKERELLTTVTSLQERVQEGLEDGARLPSLDAETLRAENGVLRDEQQRLKKVIEKQHRMMEQLGSQLRALEEQVSQEDGGSQALREEVFSKERSLLELRTAMKELCVQNQDLMEQNLTLQERVADGEWKHRASSGPQPAAARLTQRLHGEMSSCLCDLRSLCNVLTQRSQGQDPNLSLLLGIAGPPTAGEQLEDWLSPEVLQKKLVEAKQLRRDVEELRTTVSDRYAQDMGENCTTQ
ncbi:centrosomal protein of 85 kDa isoform X1 [Gadus morhua]|uniref:centrosomal protein of 85 kDa isoform X1 n=1 Tax=Gadus morhua TaxID=8049 RepID=UPI0011B369BA|nr:centrosomal protein of 85 kDa isoform X1 [Gadus morhua]